MNRPLVAAFALAAALATGFGSNVSFAFASPVAFAETSKLCAQTSTDPKADSVQFPSEYLRAFGGGNVAAPDLETVRTCADPGGVFWTANFFASIPVGFLPFFGGGEGNPDNLTPVCAIAGDSGAIPIGFLPFFGGQEGDSTALVPNCAAGSSKSSASSPTGVVPVEFIRFLGGGDITHAEHGSA